jgi:hypothetical protein
MYHEPELSEPVRLCDPRGRLNRSAVGWSRHPLHDCNLRGARLRKKRWNYWCITSDELLFSVTLADVDYLQLTAVYLYDRRSGELFERAYPWLRRGRLKLDANWGDAYTRDPRVTVVECRRQHGGVRLFVNLGKGSRGLPPRRSPRRLQADLEIRRPISHETLNVVIPWSSRRFQYTSKHNCLPVRGQIRLGERRYRLASDDCFACLDFGRGVWPYRTVWNWSSCSARVDGRPLGWNLGGRWTDGTGMTENALFYDGRVSKLSEDVRFRYDLGDPTAPWIIETVCSDRVALRFEPVYDYAHRIPLIVLDQRVHQLFGHFTGVVRPEGAAPVTVDGLFGWAEEHRARW